MVAAGTRGSMNRSEAADSALVARLARGDTDAVAGLYGRYGRPLFAYVAQLVGDAGLAEEIVQDTFVAAWRSAAAFQGRSSVASWLFGIARRQARDRLRRNLPITDPVERLESVPADDPEPEAAAIAAASRDELAAAIRRLPDQDREILVLTFARELGGPEIAEILGIPAGTVKSRLFNARRRLREQLRGRESR